MIQSQRKKKKTVWLQFRHFFLSDEVLLFFIFPRVDFSGDCLFSYSFVKFGSYDHLYEPFFKIYVILSVVPKDVLVTTDKSKQILEKDSHIAATLNKTTGKKKNITQNLSKNKKIIIPFLPNEGDGIVDTNWLKLEYTHIIIQNKGCKRVWYI